MVLGHHRLAIPSNSDFSLPQLRMMMREVERIVGREITSDQWQSLANDFAKWLILSEGQTAIDAVGIATVYFSSSRSRLTVL